MAGTNLNAEVSSTLWIRETQPVPAGSQGEGLAISAACTGTPPTTAGVFAHGCIMVQLDTSSGSKANYENTGTSALPVWNLIGDSTVGEITLARGNIIVGNASGVGTALDANDSGKILVGDGTDLASVAVSGDATLASTGALTIAAGAVTNAKVADSAGTNALGIRKSATVLWDFAVDGGTIGAIALTGSPTIPDNAVVWVESYDVLTTCTSAGADAGTIKLGLATDGDLTTAIAISDASNPWDAGAYSRIAGGLATPLTKKTTGARTFVLTVATENVTAGKICFQVAYWVSA